LGADVVLGLVWKEVYLAAIPQLLSGADAGADDGIRAGRKNNVITDEEDV